MKGKQLYVKFTKQAANKGPKAFQFYSKAHHANTVLKEMPKKIKLQKVKVSANRQRPKHVMRNRMPANQPHQAVDAISKQALKNGYKKAAGGYGNCQGSCRVFFKKNVKKRAD